MKSAILAFVLTLHAIVLVCGAIPFYGSYNQDADHPCEGEACHHKHEDQWRYPCALSPRFSASMEISVICPKTKQLKVFGLGWIYVDYLNHRARMDMMGKRDEKKIQYTAWIFFNDHKVYYTDRTSTDHKCISKSVKGSMHKPMIPNNSSFITLLQRGTEVLEMWKIPFTKHTEQQMTDKQKNKILLIDITPSTCIPVEVGLLIKEQKSDAEPEMSHPQHMMSLKPVAKVLYLNWVNDVPPYIFEMPNECTHKVETSKDEIRMEEENFQYQMMDMITNFSGYRLDKME